VSSEPAILTGQACDELGFAAAWLANSAVILALAPIVAMASTGTDSRERVSSTQETEMALEHVPNPMLMRRVERNPNMFDHVVAKMRGNAGDACPLVRA
jgi:hypothetical protein